jgi:putative Mn2+ efflux pump MntP
LKIAIFFGSFQAIMPLIGWLAGLSFRNFISGIDHWIAFGLLCMIGCKMIYESSKMEVNNKKIDPLNVYVLLIGHYFERKIEIIGGLILIGIGIKILVSHLT